MNKVFRKYRFGSKGAFTTKLNALGTAEDMEGNIVPSHPHLVKELGHEVVTEATYDEEGELLTEAVYGDAYLVDCLWSGEADPSWDNQLVWCKPFGLLVMGASEVRREWLEECKKNRPELFPEPTEDVDLV